MVWEGEEAIAWGGDSMDREEGMVWEEVVVCDGEEKDVWLCTTYMVVWWGTVATRSTCGGVT